MLPHARRRDVRLGRSVRAWSFPVRVAVGQPRSASAALARRRPPMRPLQENQPERSPLLVAERHGEPPVDCRNAGGLVVTRGVQKARAETSEPPEHMVAGMKTHKMPLRGWRLLPWRWRRLPSARPASPKLRAPDLVPTCEQDASTGKPEGNPSVRPRSRAGRQVARASIRLQNPLRRRISADSRTREDGPTPRIPVLSPASRR